MAIALQNCITFRRFGDAVQEGVSMRLIIGGCTPTTVKAFQKGCRPEGGPVNVAMLTPQKKTQRDKQRRALGFCLFLI